MTDDDVLRIVSLRAAGEDGSAVCRLSWHGLDWHATAAAVRQTAIDLVTAAAYADLIGVLLRTGRSTQGVQRLLSSVLTRAEPGRTFLGHRDTIRLGPAGSSRNSAGAVIVQRGSLGGQLDPGEARAMARQWFEAAEASEQDVLFTGVLTRAQWLTAEEMEAVFGLVAEHRAQTDGAGTVPP